MKKGGYLKKKGDGGGWHAPMALPENPKTQSPMVGPMNNPANNNIQNVPNAASSAKKANLQSVPSAGSSNVLNAADKIKIGMQNTPKQKKGGSMKKMKTGGMATKKKKYGEGGPTTKAQSTPTEQSSQPNTPPVGTNKLTGNPRLKNGGTKTTYKTGGMVNANAKLVADKSAGSKGVKSGVNPKAAASNVAKKPSKPRSKAPKKALPKAAYGMAVKGYNMGGDTGDGTQVPYGTRTFKEVTITAPKKSKGKPKAKYGMAMKGKKSC
jgi:hypothetical protein